MSVVSRVPEVALPRPDVSHRSIQVAADRPAGTAIDWRRRHARALLVGDLDRAGARARHRSGRAIRRRPRIDRSSGLGTSYAVLGVALAGMWWLSLQMHQARSPKVVGHGWEEYRRVIVATFRVFAVLAIALGGAQDGRVPPLPRDRLPARTRRPARRAEARAGQPAPRARPRARRRRRSSSSEVSGPRPSSPRGSPSTRRPVTTCAACGSPTRASRWLPSLGTRREASR